MSLVEQLCIQTEAMNTDYFIEGSPLKRFEKVGL